MADRAVQLYVRLSTIAAYIEPEILALPQDKLDRFIKETPGLALYGQQLHDLNRKRGNIRSAEIDLEFAAAGERAERPGRVLTMIDNADLKLLTIKVEAE